MSDPAAFLTARLAEVEAIAKAATASPWAWEATGEVDSSWAVGLVQDEDGNTLSGQIQAGTGVVIDGVCEAINGTLADAEHIALHDPARVLREVAAKRKILVRYEFASRQAVVNVGAEQEAWGKMAWALERDVLDLAAVYDDHPDYDPAWRT